MQKQGEAFRIARAFSKAMINLLKTGEDIQVVGFGTFKWRTTKATRGIRGYFYNKAKPIYILKDIPAKTHLIFKPAPSLIRYINEN